MSEDAATRALKKLQNEDKVNRPASETVNAPEHAPDATPAIEPEIDAAGMQGATPEKDASELVVPQFGTPEKALGEFVTALGLTLPDGMNYTDWELVGSGIRTFKEASLWIAGDYLNYGVDHYGEDIASQVVDSLGYEEGSLSNAKSVSKAIPMAERRELLSFGHHQTVMGMSAEDRKYWLDQAETHEWTRDEFREKVRAAEVKTSTGTRGRPKGAKGTRISKEKKARAEAMSAIQMAAFVEKTFAPTLSDSIEEMIVLSRLAGPMLKNIEGGVGMSNVEAKDLLKPIDRVVTHLNRLRDQAEQVAAFEPPPEKVAKPAKAPKAAKPKKTGKKTSKAAPEPQSEAVASE